MRSTLDLFGETTTYDTTDTIRLVMSVLEDNPHISYLSALDEAFGMVERSFVSIRDMEQSPNRFHVLWYHNQTKHDLGLMMHEAVSADRTIA